MRIAAVALLFAAGVSWARASEGPPPILDITTYRSPSGEFELVVDPSRLHGQGKGSYRMTRNGTEVWAGEREFTLWEASVTDTGVAGGYAYTHGWRGFSGQRADRSHGQFLIVTIDAEGTTRVLQSIERTPGGMHMPPNPLAAGCFTDQANDRLVVRLAYTDDSVNDGERWQAFRLSTGEALPDLVLDASMLDGPNVSHFILEAEPLAGTGLVLVTISRSASHRGLRLSLMDGDCREVWKREWPTEFDAIEDYSPWEARSATLVTTGPGAGEFAYDSYAAQARIRFVAAADATAPNGWRVAETGSEPTTVTIGTDFDAPLDLPAVNLEAVGVIALQGGSTDDMPALDVKDFDLDAEGRIGFISTGADGDFALTLLDPARGAGAAEIESIALGISPEEQRALPQLAWIGGQRWVVLRASHDDQAATEGFFVEADVGRVVRIEGLQCPALSISNAVEGTGDGGFLVIPDHRSDLVVAFDARGQRRWTAAKGSSPKAAAVGSGGSIGLLTGIADQIVILGADGRTDSVIELKQTLGVEPNYVAGLESDAEGGWILHDFNGHPPILRLRADGTPRASFEPHYVDGRTFRLHGSVKRAPDGRLWTSDGAAMLRLDDGGTVDLILGRGPDAPSLGELRCATVDHRGRIYAVDGRNASVHVFDATGQPLRTLNPEPGDFAVDVWIGSITVDGDGAVYYFPSRRVLDTRGYMKFDAAGQRVGFQPGISGEVVDEWIFRPGSRERLVLGYSRAFLVDADGQKTRAIERRADQRWLDNPHSGAVAPDGSFAIVASPSGWNGGRTASVTLFSASGEPQRTLDLPPSFRYARIAYTGQTACIVSDDSLVLLGTSDGRARVFTIPGTVEDRYWYPFSSPDGKEVWLLDTEAQAIHRYALPER
ncbi:MAG TPA: hypothetical protein VFD43_01415 [Planctomycetota bacterium]|nr:hypothetical protein [Planctomycetota bacterium]